MRSSGEAAAPGTGAKAPGGWAVDSSFRGENPVPQRFSSMGSFLEKPKDLKGRKENKAAPSSL